MSVNSSVTSCALVLIEVTSTDSARSFVITSPNSPAGMRSVSCALRSSSWPKNEELPTNPPAARAIVSTSSNEPATESTSSATEALRMICRPRKSMFAKSPPPPPPSPALTTLGATAASRPSSNFASALSSDGKPRGGSAARRALRVAVVVVPAAACGGHDREREQQRDHRWPTAQAGDRAVGALFGAARGALSPCEQPSSSSSTARPTSGAAMRVRRPPGTLGSRLDRRGS